MGHPYALVKIFNKDKAKYKEVTLPVDTGSTYTWISKTILNELGIDPRPAKKFRTIEGKTIEREIGEAMVECEGERATTIVVFGEKEDASVLGVYALEGLGLTVDPTTEKLKKVEIHLAI